jgi:diguanylate cyclase (GGDEF)-like protein
VRISRHLAVSIHNTILYEKVKDLSMRDSMTGLFNFRYFVETLQMEVERSVRYERPIACIMLDLDGFKVVNDTYGHVVGDNVLKELARSVSISIRSSDIPARYGGDEFIVVLPDADKDRAAIIARRLMNHFSSKRIRIPGSEETIGVTLSIGISGLPRDTVNAEELIKMADAALYQAKKKGKNQIVTY